MKKLICLVLSCMLLIFLSSCEVIDRFKGDMSKLSRDDNGNLLYDDNSYYRVDNYFKVRTITDDTVFELGWYSQFPFFPDMYFSSVIEETATSLFVITDTRGISISVSLIVNILLCMS